MNNSEITIIVPAHNRQKRLSRLVDYYTEAGIPIIISDSSENEWSESHRLPASVTYRHYPNLHLIEKILRISNEIKTPFVAMCADDDFLSIEGLRISVNLLKDSDADVKSTQGNYFRYIPKDNIRLDPLYPQIKDNSIMDASPIDRMHHLMRNYYQFYYAVYRTDFYKEVYSACVSDKGRLLNNLCLVELFISIYSVIKAKHKISNSNYAFREYIEDSAGTWVPSLKLIIDTGKGKDEVIVMINELCQVLSKETGINIDEANIEVSNALKTYLAQTQSPSNTWNFYEYGLFYKIYLFLSKTKKYISKRFNKKDQIAIPEFSKVRSIIQKYWSAVYSDN